jgi:hypothetical protein
VASNRAWTGGGEFAVCIRGRGDEIGRLMHLMKTWTPGCEALRRTLVYRNRNGLFAFCDRCEEGIGHLILGCSYSREVWFKVLRPLRLQGLLSAPDSSMALWRQHARSRVCRDARKGFDSPVLLVALLLWKERNSRIFERSSSTVLATIDRFQDESGN